jgi:hypothetical protein
MVIRHNLSLFEKTLISPLFENTSSKVEQEIQTETEKETETKHRKSEKDPNFFGKVLALTIPFLRSAALLYSILFSQTIPSLSSIEKSASPNEKGAYVTEIEHLLRFMQLPKLSMRRFCFLCFFINIILSHHIENM